MGSYDDKMKHKWTKKFISLLCQIVGTTVLIMAITIAWNGMYLLGVPSIEDIQKVTISYPELSGEPKQITDWVNIELAVKLTGFLKYSLFEKADSSEDPMITITYYLSSGKTISASANKKTVWWKGKAHAIKEDGQFIKLTEGVFFISEVNGQ